MKSLEHELILNILNLGLYEFKTNGWQQYMFKFSERKQMLASCQTCNSTTEIHTKTKL